MKRIILCITLLLSFPVWVSAQEDDRGFLTRKIEEALSGGGREVRIDGFAGALSSEASFDQLTIADEQGAWLTLKDVKLVWSRTALLRGRLEVERLSAASLDLPRLPPASEGDVELPAAEATPFALPELPVSINIETFEVSRISLGAPIIGVAVDLEVKASARLDDQGALIDMIANRLDAAEGRFVIKAGFARDTSQISLDLALKEEAGGIAARLLNLPDQPSVSLVAAGTGPLDDFTTEIMLATDGQERVAGQVSLLAQNATPPGPAPDRRIRADVGGDITALIAGDYRDFFGTDIGLKIDALLMASGEVNVDAFSLNAQSAQLSGAVRLNSDLWPSFIDIDGQISRTDGAPVLLPGSNAGVTVQSVTLDVDYDDAQGDAFMGTFDVMDIIHQDVRISQTQLALDGTLQGAAGSVGQFLTDLDLKATGLELSDENVARALGQEITGKANIDYVEGQPIKISGLTLTGTDYGLTGDVVIQGLSDGFPTQLKLGVAAQDISRFAGLAGRPLAGAADLDVEGTVTPLAGMFDLLVAGTTRDIKLDIPQADAVLVGLTELSLGARRDLSGTFVRDLDLRNAALDVKADAELRSQNSRVSGRAALSDIALVLPEYDGPVVIEGAASEDASGWTVDAKAQAPYQSALTVKGRATGPDADIVFDFSVPDVAPIVPDVTGPLDAKGRVYQTPKGYAVDVTLDGPYQSRVRVAGVAVGPDTDVRFDLTLPEIKPLVPSVAGPVVAKGRVWQAADGFEVDIDADGPYKSTISVAGLATGPNAVVSYTANLPNVAVFVPQIVGPLSVTGDAARVPQGWQIKTAATGPSGTRANIAGRVQEDGTLDLAVNGSLPLGLSSPFLAPRNLQGQAQFDLALKGPPALNSVRGQITTSNASFSAPNLRLSLSGIAATIGLNNGRAQIDARSNVVGGGQIVANGTLGLSGALLADLQVGVRNAVVTDPRLYTTTLNGDIAIDGPLSGGARIAGTINVGETNVTVPSSGLTSIGDIPAITHIGAPSDVTRTRQRAGVIAEPETTSSSSSGTGGYRLGIQVNAPGRIFVRGRGVDAELGGALQLTGTTSRIISAGRFELQRGRIDILGKRFDLVEGAALFQGDLTPFIRFVTSSSTPTGTANIVLEGPADNPTVTFESTPDAPQDEVLAQLLFGREISQISPFQALQLANAVASLAGRSGLGLVGNLRQGFGLDDLDIVTTDSGETAVRAGKYISENVYTDVTAASDGQAEVSLNLDLTKSLKARGTLEGDGNTGVGIFFERDY